MSEKVTLAELQGNEDLLNSMSSEDIQNMIQGNQSSDSNEANIIESNKDEELNESPVSDVNEAEENSQEDNDIDEEPNEDPVSTDEGQIQEDGGSKDRPKEDSDTVQKLLAQQQQLINELLKQREKSSPESKNESPSNKSDLSPDEALDLLSKDPKGFINRIISEKVGSYQEQISNLQREQAWNAAMGNETFRTMSPTIQKLRDKYPSVSFGNELNTLEAFMLIAKGMESEERTAKNKIEDQKVKSKKAKAKKSASAVAKTKPVPSKPKKDISKMSSDEILKELEKLGASGDLI